MPADSPALPAAVPVSLREPLQRLLQARHHDPFTVLGCHTLGHGQRLLVHLPGAERAWLPELEQPLTRIADTDLFGWEGDTGQLPAHPRVNWEDRHGRILSRRDPYGFPPLIGDLDQHLFGEGRHLHVYRVLGAHADEHDGIPGVRFALWAPNAERVSVVGDFNEWDGRVHPLRSRGGSGLWELFIPDLEPGTLYKYEIRNRDSGQILLKADPYGQASELRPGTASRVAAPSAHRWGDDDWMARRAGGDWLHAPLSIYEVHLGSWRRHSDGRWLDYRELAQALVDYVQGMGYTHIELLPITEHPLDASWGYQTTGYFAPTARFGEPDDFRHLVDLCHRAGIGVILDWAPGHFPRDAHGLAWFDGTALYEHADPRRGEHRDWGTLIFNYGRNEVRNFLIASAIYWMEEFHIDGLRVDAVASMLYLDYSREGGDWLPNRYGGRENLEAIDFLRELNQATHERFPGTLVIAEESTSWPQVTRPTYLGGLGFSMKWNMGWMHDTLVYMSKDPVHRHFHHNELTFGLLYAHSENFVLPFSHDEMVHGKGSMLHKMPGDDWQRFANLRCLYAYQWTYPGKKLLFMGGDIAQRPEWDCERELEWFVLDQPLHRGIQLLVRDLNHLYREQAALHHDDFDASGFDWIDCHDATQSVISYLRRAADHFVVVVINFTPVVREAYRIGVPRAGRYRVLLNTDSGYYGGGNLGEDELDSSPGAWMNQPHSLHLTLPPLAALILAPA